MKSKKGSCSSNMSNFYQINKLDNCAIAMDSQHDIKPGHKIALCDINKGDYVFKYGHIIGRATSNIKKGEWIHTHNLSSHLNESVEYTYEPNIKETKVCHGTFLGYKREKGRAGIRNDIFIIPTVGCINGVVKEIEKRAQSLVTGSIDSIFALTHQFGCSQLGEDQDNIARLLCSLALNPNASFVLFVGLGCENNSLNIIKKMLEPYERNNIAFYNCQEVDDEVEYGLSIIKSFAEQASKYQREEVNLSELCIGLKCGGSDAFSGITANPLVGKISDRLISFGGSAMLTEIPEMFGAEQILMNKCKNEKIYENYKDLIVKFKKYYTDLGYPVYENPSPGNKEGGITTLEEKSLGCITKGGESPIVDVLRYGEIVVRNGLNILEGPGNDLVSSTALAASGAQMILFTTGRGTPFSTVVPTIKIATNHALFTKKQKWIDFDASSLDEESLFELIIKAASGAYKAKQEDSHEIAFFKKGVTL